MVCGRQIWRRGRWHNQDLRHLGEKNEKRRYNPKKFFPGQIVLAYDAVAASSREDKFLPHWKGPYELQYKVVDSMWKVKEIGTERGVGRHWCFTRIIYSLGI